MSTQTAVIFLAGNGLRIGGGFSYSGSFFMEAAWSRPNVVGKILVDWTSFRYIAARNSAR
jgi:hypothetical protein